MSKIIRSQHPTDLRLISAAVALTAAPLSALVEAQNTPFVQIDATALNTMKQVDLSNLPVADGPFGGTWDSNFGELRLHQTDDVVIGDYGSKGIILGEVITPNCIAGVFTNGDRFGQFSFRVIEAGRVTGVYRWGEGGSGAAWEAEQTSAFIPASFSNFKPGTEALAHGTNDNDTLNGDWQTNFGTLRLRHSDLFLYGDYANRGIIAARWDGQQFVGLFTNRELAAGNQVGKTTFTADMLNGKLTGGSWSLPNGSAGSWRVDGGNESEAQFNNIAPDGSCAPLWPF